MTYVMFKRSCWQKASINTNHQSLHLSSPQSFYLAIAEGHLTNNPVKGVKFFPETLGRFRFLSDAEIGRLREVMRQMIGQSSLLHWKRARVYLNNLNNSTPDGIVWTLKLGC